MQSQVFVSMVTAPQPAAKQKQSTPPGALGEVARELCSEPTDAPSAQGTGCLKPWPASALLSSGRRKCPNGAGVPGAQLTSAARGLWHPQDVGWKPWEGLPQHWGLPGSCPASPGHVLLTNLPRREKDLETQATQSKSCPVTMWLWQAQQLLRSEMVQRHAAPSRTSSCATWLQAALAVRT